MPADDKDAARVIVARVVVQTLKDLKMKYPVVSDAKLKELKAIGKELAR